MRFGQKFDRERSTSSDNVDFIRAFKDGETTVRFLQELEDWTEYYECYNEGTKRYYPSPGKGSKYAGERASRRFLVSCLVDGRVGLYKVPTTLMDRLIRRSDKNGTITDRDYVIIREGKGLNTSYDIETGERAKIDLSAFSDQMKSHSAALKDAFIEAWGQEAYDEVEDGEDKESRSSRSERPAKRTRSEEDEDDDPPSKPQPEKESPAEDDEEVLSEEDIRSMSKRELIALAGRAGIDEIDTDLSAAELADFIIDTLSE